MEQTVSGIVLRESAYGDNDKLITALCGEKGLLSFFAKGVRSVKSRNSSALQLFCYSTFELTAKGEHYTLKTATVNDTFYGLRDDLERLYLASYMAEAARSVASENADESELTRLLLNLFYALSRLKEIPPEKIKAVFELKTAVIEGFMPHLSSCGVCGALPEDCTGKDGLCRFSLSEGVLVCPKCAVTVEGASSSFVRLSETTRQTMTQLIVADQKKMLQFSWENDAGADLSAACERYLEAQVGRRFSTLDFYKSIRNDS